MEKVFISYSSYCVSDYKDSEASSHYDRMTEFLQFNEDRNVNINIPGVVSLTLSDWTCSSSL